MTELDSLILAMESVCNRDQLSLGARMRGQLQHQVNRVQAKIDTMNEEVRKKQKVAVHFQYICYIYVSHYNCWYIIFRRLVVPDVLL